MYSIDNLDKKVNVIQKTEMDWENYTKKEGIKDDLERNRKDGFLVKQRFLDKVSDQEYQQKKVAEKEKIQQLREKFEK